MKSLNFSKLLLISLVLSVTAVGCRKGIKSITPIPTQGADIGGGAEPWPPIDNVPGGVAIPGPTSPDASPLTTDEGIPPSDRPEEGNYWVDREMFQDQVVYFDFDRSTIKPLERPKVEAVAGYLRSNPTALVRVEGHCDERGTEEYNRALGERRALAVREYLAALGIDPARLSNISFGEDRPAVLGQDEASHARNRRAEFVVLIPKS